MAPLTALHRQTVPPSGHSLAVACRLTGDARQRHLVTARNNALHVYAVRENRLVWLATRQLHGRVTGLQRLAAKGGDRLVVAVHHAKMCLLEWDERQHDLCPVSLHTYEKLPQVDDEREAHLSVDPASRLVALLLPTNSGGDATLALLPLFAAEDTGDDNEIEGVPYAPSHLVPLASLTQPVNAPQGAPNAFAPNASTPPIRNVVSMAFLPGFTEPTLALLYAPDWTWAGRLEYLAQNFLVSLVTLSTKSEGGTRAVVISTSPALPYSCLALKPCPTALGGTGGVLVTTANGLLYVDAQSGRVVAVPVNGWFARDYPPGRPKPAGLVTTGDAATPRERLEGSRLEFYTHATATEDDDDDAQSQAHPVKALVWCRSGAVFDLSFTLTGRTIASLHLERVADAGSLTGGGAASLIRLGGDLIFVGSETGSSALLRWRDTLKNEAAPSNVLDLLQAVPARSEAMDVDQDEEGACAMSTSRRVSLIHSRSRPPADIYGDAKPQPAKIDPSALASLASALAAQKPSPVQLEVCDTLPGYGAIRNMTTGLIDEEVRDRATCNAKRAS